MDVPRKLLRMKLDIEFDLLTLHCKYLNGIYGYLPDHKFVMRPYCILSYWGETGLLCFEGVLVSEIEVCIKRKYHTLCVVN